MRHIKDERKTFENSMYEMQQPERVSYSQRFVKDSLHWSSDFFSR